MKCLVSAPRRNGSAVPERRSCLWGGCSLGGDTTIAGSRTGLECSRDIELDTPCDRPQKAQGRKAATNPNTININSLIVHEGPHERRRRKKRRAESQGDHHGGTACQRFFVSSSEKRSRSIAIDKMENLLTEPKRRKCRYGLPRTYRRSSPRARPRPVWNPERGGYNCEPKCGALTCPNGRVLTVLGIERRASVEVKNRKK